MNLKNFKLKSESEDSFHIVNPHGRVFTVMKKELHPKAHAEIMKLADGGDVPAQDPMSVLAQADQSDMPNDVASGVEPGSQQAASQAFANSGMNQTQGAADQYQQAKADFDAAQAAAQKNNDLSSQQDLQRAKENLQDATSNLSATAQQQASTPSVQNTSMPQGQIPPQAQQGNQQQAQGQVPQQPDYLSQMAQSRENALNAEEKGAQDLSDTLQKSIGQQQQSYQDLINQQKGMKTPQQIADEYKAKDAAFMQQVMNSKIDPNRYFKNQSTGQHILSAIAMAIGGAGSALSGQQNIAANKINQAVENDIAAQQNDQSKTLNLWKMNRENMNSDMEASIATRNQLLSLAQAKLAMAGANVQNAQARLQAQQMISQIEQQKLQNRMLLGQTGMGGGSQADPTRLVSMLVPQQQQAQAFKELGQAKAANQNEGQIMKLFDAAAKNARPLTGGNAASLMNTVPGYELPEIKNMRLLFYPIVHDNEGRVNEYEIHDVQTNMPQWGDSDSTIAKKRLALQNFINSKKQAPTASGYGINPEMFSSTTSNPVLALSPQKRQWYQWAKANPNRPEARAFLAKEGLQ
jgi:hypothetical protein